MIEPFNAKECAVLLLQMRSLELPILLNWWCMVQQTTLYSWHEGAKDGPGPHVDMPIIKSPVRGQWTCHIGEAERGTSAACNILMT